MPIHMHAESRARTSLVSPAAITMRQGAIRELHSTEQQTSYETCLQLFLDIVINFLLDFSWISFLSSYTNSFSHSFSGCTLKTRTLSIENAKLSEMDDGSPRTALPFCHYLFLLLFPWTRNNLSFNFLDLTFIFFYSFHYDFCYLCYLQAMRVEPKNEETRTPIDERTRLNDDDDENENERTNETRSKRTQVMKEEDPPIYMLASPALLCFASPLYLLGI